MPVNDELYQRFVMLKEAGKKQEATAALNAFLASCGTHDADTFQPAEAAEAKAKRAWVYAFLEQHRYGHKVRHELYAQLIFPVLLEGYRLQDARNVYWLAATAPNLYDSPGLHILVGTKTEEALLREAYAIQPVEAVRKRLLIALLNWLRYCQHEWPAGILYDADGANLAQCEEILQEAAFAQSLDTGENAAFFEEFERRVQEYRQRLHNKSTHKISI